MAGSDNEENFESSPENSLLISDSISEENFESSSENSSISISPPPTPPPSPPQNMEVEHYSERPLPYFWRQHRDLRTGEEYFVNWNTGFRTSVDPRISVEAAEAAGYFLSDEDEDEDDDGEDGDDEDSSEDDDEDHEYSGNHEDYSSDSSNTWI